MDLQTDKSELMGVSRKEAAEHIKALLLSDDDQITTQMLERDLMYHAWPQFWPNSGHPAAAGGLVMNAFCIRTMEAWSSQYRHIVWFCEGRIIRVFTDGEFLPFKKSTIGGKVNG